ncbi:MAG: dehydrogenase [Acidimicrobiia bacterium]|nr:dehydrogenase [Acidimicrobiia bacterium]
MAIVDDAPQVDTAEEAAFRDRVRRFLEANAQRRKSKRDGDEDDLPAVDPESEQLIAQSKAYQKALTDAGLAFLTWPKRYGGAELTKRHQEIFNEEASDYELPNSVFQIGHGMCAPTILEFGTDEQRDTFLPTLMSGEKIWCQLYSEPGAGSDVASLQTRAVRDGDEWIVSGQKVWTSGAHYSEWGILIARTNVDAPKHKGITMFIVDMRTPGMEIKPLKQITKASNFNEVFFTDARVPHANVLGTVDDGWRLSVALLMNERVAIGASGGGPRGGGVNALVRSARRNGSIGDPVVRQGLADVYTLERLMGFTGQRIRAAQKAGRAPGPEGSLGKLLGAIIARRQSDLGMAIAGASSQAWSAEDHQGDRWALAVLNAPASAIAGGTNEIQKNIIGERILGLPKEPQVDREQPFKELKVGTQRA